MSIGSKIKQLRTDKNWTLRELAKMTGGISVSYLSDIEKDRTKPSFEVFERIAGAFDISAAELMGGSSNDLTADELKLLKAYREDNWRVVLSMLLTHSKLKWGNDNEYDESGFDSMEEFENILEKVARPIRPTKSHNKKYWTDEMLQEENAGKD